MGDGRHGHRLAVARLGFTTGRVAGIGRLGVFFGCAHLKHAGLTQARDLQPLSSNIDVLPCHSHQDLLFMHAHVIQDGRSSADL
jgi:hypothetical protein